MVANIKHINDYKFVDRYLCGDRAAGQELYASIFPIVKGFIYCHSNARTLSEEEKEEVFSDTLNTSIEKLEFYNGQSSFSTYVCAIAKYKILEKVKEVVKENKVIELTESTCIYDDPLTILVEKELREDVSEAQKMLSVEHRDVMNLRLNGMSARQISELTQMSEDAVNSMFYRAIKSFKKYFEKIYYK